MGAGELCEDGTVFPIRGQLVRAANPGLDCCRTHDVPGTTAYVIPRSSDCILGGTAEVDNANLAVDPETAQAIVERCARLDPSLARLDVLEHMVGLRPGRGEVRLEIEPVSTRCGVIHNYGHGGAGYTMSWGCAEEVVALVPVT